MDFKQFYKRINFDIDQEIRLEYRVTEGDTKSRGFIISLVINDVITPVTENESMVFYAMKPDKTRVMTNAIKDGDVFRVDLTNQTFAVPGIVLCALGLYGPNGEKIVDKKFKMIVDNSLENGAIISEDERGIIDRAFDLANNVVPRLELLNMDELELYQDAVSSINAVFETVKDIDERFKRLSVQQQQDSEVIIARQGEVDLNTNLQNIKNSIYGAIGPHLDSLMPHAFYEGGKRYNWGFRMNQGNPQFVYEEVII